jgi:hypothetical protein
VIIHEFGPTISAVSEAGEADHHREKKPARYYGQNFILNFYNIKFVSAKLTTRFVVWTLFTRCLKKKTLEYHLGKWASSEEILYTIRKCGGNG